VRNNPRDFVALLELTSYSKGLNDPEFSIAQLRAFLSRISRDENPEFYDNLTDQLAGELEKRGRIDEALALFAELVRLNPNEASFWAGYGSVLSGLGRHEEAIRALHRAIELGPSEYVLHEVLAASLVNSGDLASAETEYRAALSLYEAQYKKGESSDTLGRKLVKIQAENHAELFLAETRLKLAHVPAAGEEVRRGDC
jgi:tetratricopeptide (TPR) repeat protein